ncbi:sensor histidine kinase [Actinoplanes sp. CA-030573]|uniref:sensor histidine kinase n=1 Tax=Actinoplanes sp. CA-030573 TaxID=3239898 RepID=UPI003D929DD9
MTRIRWWDVVLAGVFTAGIGVEIATTFTATPGHAVTATLMLATGVALVWRRVAPVAVAAVAAAACTAPAAFGPRVETLSLGLTFVVVSYSAMAYAPDLRAAVLGGGVLAAGMSVYSWTLYPGVVNLLIAWLQGGAVFVVGLLVRRQRRTADTSEKRARLAEQAREQHAAEAVAAERARIARDLHDVVAHAISVIVLQARGGRRMLAVDPAESRTAFDAIEQLGEHALTDMRHLLGLLRAAADADLAPQPSLRHLDALVARLSRPGLTMVADVEGDLDTLPAGVDIAGYRIVQESLTNVVRHAAASTASVAVRVEPAALRIEVSDDGTGAGAAGGEPGFGLLGMRERVALYGGTLDAGAASTGGFRVRACLPVPA